MRNKRKNGNEESREKETIRMRNNQNKKCECPDGVDKETNVPLIKPNIIESFRNAQKCLRRTMVDNDVNTHKGIVCVVCDGQITGTVPVCHLDKDQILKHKNRLSVQSYNEYFGRDIDPVLAKQYEVDDLPGILLSPRSNKNKEGKCVACSHCHSSLSNKDNLKNENPPKCAIANGLAVGYLPENLEVQMPYGDWVKMRTVGRDEKGNIVVEHLTPVICAAVAPARPHAYVLVYNGGRHKTIKGNYQFLKPTRVRLQAL